MDERYFSKVAAVIDEYTVVINKGSVDGVKSGDKFLVIGLGELIFDPDTNEELERLELVRGETVAVHVQEKVSTLISNRYSKEPDTKKVTISRASTMNALLGHPESKTETVIPGESFRRTLDNPKVGDYAIRQS